MLQTGLTFTVASSLLHILLLQLPGVMKGLVHCKLEENEPSDVYLVPLGIIYIVVVVVHKSLGEYFFLKHFTGVRNLTA